MPFMSNQNASKPAAVDAAYTSAQKVVEMHHRLAKWLRHGVTLAAIDAFVAKTLDEMGSRSCFLGYKAGRSPAFPSHACLSVNECVVHGTAGYLTRPMQSGDVLKIDIGVAYRGWIGDAAWTYAFDEPAPEVRRLMECGKRSLELGIDQLRAGRALIEWARVVQGHAETECGFHLIRGLGGHGYGRSLHSAPFVSNVVPAYPGEWPDAFTPCKPGMLVAVEPMIAIGTGKTVQKAKQWPVYTADGSMSVHYEHDVLVTENGPRVLTEGLDEVKDVVES